MTAAERKSAAAKLRELALLVENDHAKIDMEISAEVDIEQYWNWRHKDGSRPIVHGRGRQWTITAVTLR